MGHGHLCVIPARIFDIEGVDPSDVAVLAALAAFADKDGFCFPRQATIGALLRRDRTWVSRRLAKLERLGVLESQDRSGRGKEYRIQYNHISRTPDVQPSHTRCVDGEHLECDVHTQKDKKKELFKHNATLSGVTEFDYEREFGIQLPPATQGMNLNRVFSILLKFKLDTEAAQLVLLEFQALADAGKLKQSPFDTLAALATVASRGQLRLSARGEKVRQKLGGLWA
jgi:hypothetical protein